VIFIVSPVFLVAQDEVRALNARELHVN